MNQIERSLLQKAVRRGNQELTEKVVTYLLAKDDTTWLKNRLTVMTYEECWPLGAEINPSNNLLSEFSKLAVSVKNKNAAGLASLALENNRYPDTAGHMITKALKDPEWFWEWAKMQRSYEVNKFRVEAAKKLTDKALAYAVVYLTLTEPVPGVQTAQPNTTPDFPYWTAIDKHTDIGLSVYWEVAQKVKIEYHRVMRIAYYLEGTQCSQSSEAPYWDMLSNWQIERMGMPLTEAEDHWEEIKPLIIEATKEEVVKLQERINNPPQNQYSDQLSLF